MEIRLSGFLYKNNIVFAELFIGNNINIPIEVKIFNGTRNEAVLYGLDFTEFDKQNI